MTRLLPRKNSRELAAFAALPGTPEKRGEISQIRTYFRMLGVIRSTIAPRGTVA